MPAGRPVTLQPLASGITIVYSTPGVISLSKGSGTGISSSVRFGTTRVNSAVESLVGFLTDAFVAVTVTVDTPGLVALPSTKPVFALYLRPAGSPFTVIFGAENDLTW